MSRFVSILGNGRKDPKRFCLNYYRDVSGPIEVDVEWELDHTETLAENKPFASLTEVAEKVLSVVSRGSWERAGSDPYNDYSEREGTWDTDLDGSVWEYRDQISVKRCSGKPLTWGEAVRLDKLLLEDRKYNGALEPRNRKRYEKERWDMIFAPQRRLA